MATRDNYWIYNTEIQQSPNQMYRSYIFNFQEDMWRYVYKNIYKDTPNQRDASKQVFTVLRENRKNFMSHLKDTEDDIIIEDHVEQIEQSMNDLLDRFEDETETLFYRGVLRVHNEFAM